MDNVNLIDKKVIVKMENHFNLHCVLRQIDDYGVWVETEEQTSYIGFSEIRMIKLDKKGR